jgi:hypothetical protein
MRRRVLLLASSGVLSVAMVGLGVGVANATTTPTPTPKSSQTAHSSDLHHRHALRSELRALAKGGANLGDEGQLIATQIVDNHPKLFAKLPSALKTDLTTLKNDAESQRAADATKIEKTALSGGYGSRIKTLAQKIEAHLTAKK